MSGPQSTLRNVCTAALVLLLSFLSQAQAAQTPGAAPLAATDPTEITLRVQTPTYTLDAAGLRVDGYGANDAPGAPVLPAWGTLVELPPAGDWTLTIEPGTAVEIRHRPPLPAVPVPDPVLPGPNGWSSVDELPTSVPVVDRPDPQIYGANAFYPASIVRPGVEQWQRGRRLLALRVFPFQYNPVAGRVRYYADVRVTVSVLQPDVGELAKHPSTAPAGSAQDAQVTGGSADDAGSILSGTTPLGSSSGGVQSKDASDTNPAAGGGSLRIRTSGRGMVGLTYDALVKATPAVATADRTTFAITYLGETVDIRTIDELPAGWSTGDSLVFYAEPYEGRYLDHNVYWFTWGGTASDLMATRTVNQDPAAPDVRQIQRTLHIETDRLYMSTIERPKDADHWFDGPVGPPYAPISYTLDLLDPVPDGELTLRALINSGGEQSTNDRSVALNLNKHDAGAYAWTGLIDHLAATTVPASWLDATPNELGIWPGTGIVYPDWVEVSYQAEARAYDDNLYIESIAAGANEVVVKGFSDDEVKIYDIRDPLHPVLIDAPLAQLDGTTYTQHFWDANLAGPTYYLNTDAKLAAPKAIEQPVQDGTPSLLTSPANQADYIAIVHRDLWDAIDPLLDHRSDDDGFAVAKVDVQQIYDEFSDGRRDPEAIRSFLAYAFKYWKGPSSDAEAPQYVVLVGDGHYDFTGVSGTTLPNLVPPYLLDIDPWLGETAADNRFVSVDPPANGEEDILPEMSIGRIPAQTPDEVTAVVNKILAYETATPGGDWQRRVYYVADSCLDGGGDYHWLSDQSREGWLPAAYDDRTVYYGNTSSCPESDTSTASGMQAGVRAAFDDGALMVQWFGHASRSRWGKAAEYPDGQLPIYVNSSNVIPTLNANTVWPVTFSYTCLSGYFMNLAQPWFINYMDESVGEALLLTAERGSIADVSPSGEHVGSALLVLNQGVTKAIFQNRIDRVGPAVDAARLHYYTYSSMFLDVVDTSILFGDPATRLRLPPITGIQHTVLLPLIVTLSWKDEPQHDSYAIWRSTSPYFLPGDPGSEKRGEVLAPTEAVDLAFDDTNAAGDVANNYAYLILGINAYGAGDVSNRTGEFDFVLTPGQGGT